MKEGRTAGLLATIIDQLKEAKLHAVLSQDMLLSSMHNQIGSANLIYFA